MGRRQPWRGNDRENQMKKQNDISAIDAEGKAKVFRWIFAQMFSREPLPDNIEKEILSFLADGKDAELKMEALGDAYLRSFRSPGSRPLSAEGEREWSRLASELGLPYDREKAVAAWRARNVENTKALRRPRWGRIALRVAAVSVPVALVVGGYLGYVRWSKDASDRTAQLSTLPAMPFTKTVVSHADSVRQIVLADGTEVMLNRNSAFAYNENREVQLSGEAYFKVARDTLRPFVIRSEKMTVSVLGTEFNFNTDTGNGTSELSLYSGVVEIDHSGETDRLDLAGKELNLDHATNMAVVGDFDATKKPQWVTEAEDVFNFMMLGEIFDAIEAAYGVTITGRESVDMTKQYNFRIDKSIPVADVMAVLKIMNIQLDYTIDGNIIELKQADRR